MKREFYKGLLLGNASLLRIPLVPSRVLRKQKVGFGFPDAFVFSPGPDCWSPSFIWKELKGLKMMFEVVFNKMMMEGLLNLQKSRPVSEVSVLSTFFSFFLSFLFPSSPCPPPPSPPTKFIIERKKFTKVQI